MKRLHRSAKVRAWTAQGVKDGRTRGRKPRKRQGSVLERIEHVMVFDTETSVDKEQRFNFGAALYMAVGKDGEFHPVGEYLIYADDLPERNPEGFAVLQDYVLRGHSKVREKYAPADRMTMHDMTRSGWDKGKTPEQILSYGLYGWYPKNDFSTIVDFWKVNEHHVERESADDIMLVSQSEFAERLHHAAYPSDSWKANKPATVVGFNLPFDLSRIASGVTMAQKKYAGGFSFEMRKDAKSGNIRTVKRGIKGAMFGYTGGKEGDDYFTDAGTLAFGLANKSYSLANAAEAFGVSERKSIPQDGHGSITLDYIHYCRQDVRTTAALYVALVKELDRHPIDLTDNRVYSPASIAKAYLDVMGVPKPLDKQADFPNDVLGYSMATFYGGRAEAHIRKVPVPVLHVDVTSMYPTVNANMKLWDLLTAERIDVREETDAVRSLVESATVEDLLRRETWESLRGIALVMPDDDLLPVRTSFGGESDTIGISYVTSGEPMWWSIPDIINARLNGGKAPRILRALRFYPDGEKVQSLRPVDLRGQVRIDPARDDFFRTVIERRQAIKRKRTCDRKSGCLCQGCRNEQFLKVIANAGGYGIFVEVNREDDKEESVETIYGSHGSWTMNVRKPETAGAYCFPPIGTLITGAARLMLGILEKLVTDEGGTWVMCDTDSMAIAASQEGGWIAPECALPPRSVDADYPGAIPLLSYEVVEEIRHRFDSLNPYDPKIAGPVPILKREQPEELTDPQVYCYAISAKRYTMLTIPESGRIDIVVNKEHGLGQYMNPEDPSDRESRGQRAWIRDIWEYIIRSDAGESVAEPYWFRRPVMSRVTVSTWNTYAHLRRWNDGKEYADRIKPYGFMMAPVVANRIMRGTDFRLIGPYSTNSDEWRDIEFQNMHDPQGPTYRIDTEIPEEIEAIEGCPIVRVKSYADVVGSYSVHPEEKFADADGKPCRLDTRGILYRHHVNVSAWTHQGKETNQLEERETDTFLDAQEIITDYGTGLDDFQRFAVPVLKTLTGPQVAERASAEGVSVTSRSVNRILNGQQQPGGELKSALVRVAVAKAVEDIGSELPESQWRHRPTACQQWREVLSAWAER